MTRRAAVIGHPVGHSLSPLIHTHWLAQYGIEGTYEAIDTGPADLPGQVRRLMGREYAGFNVTIPHKVAIMELCDTLDDVARAIGAVNTVRFAEGKIHGANTDAFGFLENLRDQCPEWAPEAGMALVLGAGGAARAVVYALRQAGVPDIVLSNRTREKAEELGRAVSWQDRSLAAKDAALIINTTSLGLSGQEGLEIDLPSSRAIVYDIVYRPLMTPLLRQAAERNLPVVTGLGMLLHQARPSFAAWFGVMPEIDKTLREKVLKAAS